MASLIEALQNKNKTQLVRGPGGSLQEQAAPTPVAQMAGQQGLATPPTTALGGALIGANPDQQKMLGGPAQLNAIANKQQNNASPQQDLSTALRTKQTRTQATDQEQQEIQKSKDMENLGGLGDRVTNFVNAQRQQLQTQAQAAAGGQAVAVGAQDAFNGKDITAYKDDLAALRANPNDMNLMLKVQQELGMDISTQLDPAQINKLYQDSISAIAQGGAQNVADKLTVNDIVSQPEFGYDINSLSQLLGVDPTALAGMTVGQLSDQVNKVTEQEMSNVDAMNQKAQSGQLGIAEQGLAQQAGREASATGLRATEEDMHKLASSIANADKVTFGGKVMDVEDLLKDETISGLITEYLQAPPGSDIRNAIDKSESQLAEFIKNNQAALEDAASRLSAGATSFQGIQDYNKSLVKDPFGGIALSSDVAAKLIPGFGQLQASKVDPASVPLLSYVQTLPPQNAQKVANEINKQQSTDPTTAEQIAQLDNDEIANLGIDRNKSPWTKYVSYQQSKNEIDNLDPQVDKDKILTSYYSDVMSMSEAQERIRKAGALTALGFDTGMNPPPRDASGDISTSSLRGLLQDQYGQTTLKDVADGAIPKVPEKQVLGNPNIPNPSTVEGSLYTKMANAAYDGKISSDDIKGANLTQDEAIALLRNSKKENNNIDVGAAYNKFHDVTLKFLQGDGGDLSNQGNIDRLVELTKSDPTHYPPDIVMDEVVLPAKDAQFLKSFTQYPRQPGTWRIPTGPGNTAFDEMRKVIPAMSNSIEGVTKASQQYQKGLYMLLQKSSVTNPASVLKGLSLGNTSEAESLLQIAQKLGLSKDDANYAFNYDQTYAAGLAEDKKKRDQAEANKKRGK